MGTAGGSDALGPDGGTGAAEPASEPAEGSATGAGPADERDTTSSETGGLVDTVASRRGTVASQKSKEKQRAADILARITEFGLKERKKKRGRYHSDVWKFFQEYGSGAPATWKDRAVCMLCKDPKVGHGQDYVEIKRCDGSTSGLKKHLQHAHAKEWAAAQESEPAPAADSQEGALENRMRRGQKRAKAALSKSSFLDDFTEMVVKQNLPFSFIEDGTVERMLHSANPALKIPSRTALMDNMFKKKIQFSEAINLMLRGEVMTVCSDSWAAHGKTYLGITYHWIDEHWVLRSICVDVVLVEGRTIGQELELFLEKKYTKRTAQSFWMHVTDCEPSMVKAARLLKAPERELKLGWQGCSAHRLEKTSAQAFKHFGVDTMIRKCRAIASYFNKSTQAASRLETACADRRLDYRKIIQDVETRLWSTYSMLESLLHVQEALITILADPHLPAVGTQRCPNLTDEEWELAERVREVLYPFMRAQVIHPTLSFTL